jgi:hypothetical protein
MDLITTDASKLERRVLDWNTLMATKEDLHPELKPYIETTDSGLVFLKHPLVTTLYHEQMNAMYNVQLVERRKYLDELIVRKEWVSAVFTFERPYRFEAFLSMERRMPAALAADLLLDVWQDTEFPWQQKTEWLKAFRRHVRESRKMKASKKALPAGKFTVFRGALANEARVGYGMSWTLERERAEWFAKRFGQGGIVHELQVSKSVVFAHLVDRGEAEVIIDTGKVRA